VTMNHTWFGISVDVSGSSGTFLSEIIVQSLEIFVPGTDEIQGQQFPLSLNLLHGSLSGITSVVEIPITIGAGKSVKILRPF